MQVCSGNAQNRMSDSLHATLSRRIESRAIKSERITPRSKRREVKLSLRPHTYCSRCRNNHHHQPLEQQDSHSSSARWNPPSSSPLAPKTTGRSSQSPMSPHHLVSLSAAPTPSISDARTREAGIPSRSTFAPLISPYTWVCSSSVPFPKSLASARSTFKGPSNHLKTP